MAYVKLITADNKEFYTSNGNLFRVPGIFTYTVTTHFTNVSGTNVPETLRNGQTATFTVSAATNYYLPFSISVTGVSYTYDRNTGTITLGDNAWDDIDITIVATSELLTINLYQSSAEQIRVDKTSFLTSVGTLTGVLRSECSVSTPVIMVEAQALPTFNYAYISLFNRYYYVTEIQSVRNGLWAIYMSCDVLMTYKNGITGLTTTVSRNENVSTQFIVDNRVISKASKNIQLFNSATGEFDLWANQVLFDVESVGKYDLTEGKNVWIDTYRYVLTASADLSPAGSIGPENKMTTPVNIPVGRIPMVTTFQSNWKYLLCEKDVQILLGWCLRSGFEIENLFSNNPAEAFISLKAYPFDFKSFVNPWTDLGDYKIGTYQVRDENGVPWSNWWLFNDFAIKNNSFDVLHFHISKTNLSWIDYSASYSLFLPFYGFINLPADEIIDKYINVKYVIDFNTGSCLAQIGYDNSTFTYFREFMRVNFNIGIDIPFSASNHQEVSRNIIQTGMLLLGAASFGTTTALAVPEVAAGATSTALTVAGSSPNLPMAGFAGQNSPIELSLIPHASANINRRETASLTSRASERYVNHIYRGTNVGNPAYDIRAANYPYILKEVSDYVYPTNYAKEQGYPLYETKTLSTLSGYTECIDVKITGADFATALQSEVVEIKHFLETGVILPVTSS